MTEYKVKASIFHNGVNHLAGDIIELTKDEASAWGQDYVEVNSEEKVDLLPSEMTKPQLIEALTNLGVEFNEDDKKAILVSLLEETLANGQSN